MADKVLDKCDEQGYTALNIATLEGDLAEVIRLLKLGANPNIAENNGTTPLMNAAAGKSVEMVKALLKYGAIIDDKDNFGDSAVNHAQGAINHTPEYASTSEIIVSVLSNYK